MLVIDWLKRFLGIRPETPPTHDAHGWPIHPYRRVQPVSPPVVHSYLVDRREIALGPVIGIIDRRIPDGSPILDATCRSDLGIAVGHYVALGFTDDGVVDEASFQSWLVVELTDHGFAAVSGYPDRSL